MKIYEKPMAIINKFEVEDVIAASLVATGATEKADINKLNTAIGTATDTQGVVFQW